MMTNHLSIGETAAVLGVSIQTLRRWDAHKFFVSERKHNGSHRTYDIAALNAATQQEKLDLVKMARSWATHGDHWHPLDSVYCTTKDVFQVRLQALEQQLAAQSVVAGVFSGNFDKKTSIASRSKPLFSRL